MSTKININIEQGQKHQNTFAFKHNINSKLSKKF